MRDDSGDEVYAVWYEGTDGTTWTPTMDWLKNWRTYVTNVPECYRSDFEAPHGVYEGDSMMLSGATAGPLGCAWKDWDVENACYTNFEDAGWEDGFQGFQEAVTGCVAATYKERAAWEATKKRKVAFLLHFLLNREKPLPLEVAKNVLQKAKVFCWRPGTDEKDWDHGWVHRSGWEATEATEATEAEDFSGLTVKELKAVLRSRGLPVSGRKAELLARLGAAA